MTNATEKMINEPIERLISEYMQKMRDEYFKTEDKTKEIKEFLNLNFSKYIHSFSHDPNTERIAIYFMGDYEPYISPYTISWKLNIDKKYMYYIETGKVVNTIDEMIPDICNIIAKLEFKKEINRYSRNKMDEFPKFPIWKFWKWAWE